MHILKFSIVLVSFLVYFHCCECSYNVTSVEELHHREKRFVVYPYNGQFKALVSYGMPVRLGIKQSMAMGWELQWQYPVPTNVSVFHYWPKIIPSRKRREDRPSDRALAYDGIENFLYDQGINGRQCLLRSICENAVASTHHRANGLPGKLIHIALTPDYGDGEIEPDLDPVYLEAQRAGEFKVDCMTLYPDCRVGESLLDFVSVLDYLF